MLEQEMNGAQDVWLARVRGVSQARAPGPLSLTSFADSYHTTLLTRGTLSDLILRWRARIRP
jgi:hypothetical protein